MKSVTLNAGVRPGRIAVLTSISDQHWSATCHHILQALSAIWGGAGAIIVPTDGYVISDIFWEILEAYDPDYILHYRTTLRDLKERDTAAFNELVEKHYAVTFESQGEASQKVQRMQQVSAMLSRTVATDFSISEDLDASLRHRLAPFFFDRWTVQPGALNASGLSGYPHCETVSVLPEPLTGTLLSPAKDLAPLQRLWITSIIGCCTDSITEQLTQRGLRTSFLGRSNLADVVQCGFEAESSPHSISPAMFTSLNLSKLSEIHTPVALSLKGLGRYRNARATVWTLQTLTVCGSTIEDFCLYLALSRMRERVFWRPSPDFLREGDDDSAQFSFNHKLISQSHYSNQHATGLQITSISISKDGLSAIKQDIEQEVFYGPNVELADAAACIPHFPLRYYEAGNAGIARVQYVPEDGILNLFDTPKPRKIANLNPHDHRWITEIQIQGCTLPSNPTWLLAHRWSELYNGGGKILQEWDGLFLS